MLLCTVGRGSAIDKATSPPVEPLDHPLTCGRRAVMRVDASGQLCCIGHANGWRASGYDLTPLHTIEEDE